MCSHCALCASSPDRTEERGDQRVTSGDDVREKTNAKNATHCENVDACTLKFPLRLGVRIGA